MKGRVFYIDSKSGDNSSDGISEKSPWKDFSPLLVLKLLAGDTVYLKKSSAWNHPSVITGEGEPGNPISIKTYGDGESPLIKSSDPLKDVGLTVNNPSYLHIEGIRFRGGKLGLYLRFDQEKTAKEIKIQNCCFEDMTDKGADATVHDCEFAWSAGIFIGGQAPGERTNSIIEGLEICGNHFLNCGIGIISNWYWPVEPRRDLIKHLLIENNKADRCYGGGFALSYGSDITIRNFTITKSGGHSAFGTTGAFLQSTADVLIENCHISETASPGCHDGVGMDFEGNNRRVVFRNNLITDCDGPAVLFCCTEGVNQEILIEKNRFAGNGKDPENSDYRFELLNWTDRNEVEIYGKNSGQIINNIIEPLEGNDPFSNGKATAKVPFEWDLFDLSGNRIG